MGVVVRRALESDHREAGRVTAEAYREFIRPGETDWERYLARIEDVGERAERTTVLVAEEDGRILGSLTLELDGRVRDPDDDHPPLAEGEAHIRMLGVDPEARGRGVARALMAESEAIARAAGKRVMTLNTTERMAVARAMYERLGYERMEDTVFPDGFVLLGYMKRLR
jgi:ribosomal protein S18 acetylase RimI-like enzyme